MRVGILGAGQLCRMLILAGMPLGVEFNVYAPYGDHCISHLGNLQFGDWDDEKKLIEFAKQCDVVTFESENIPVGTLELLMKSTQVSPSLKALSHSQDRLKEKALFSQLGIPNVAYTQVDTLEGLQKFMDHHQGPVVLKKRRLGYDGKGQWRLHHAQDLLSLTDENLKDCIVEKLVPFEREVSVLGLRTQDNQFSFYDLCENSHENGILHSTVNRPHDSLTSQAHSYMYKLLNHLDYVGCCALELFEVDGQLMANEMAPRVHNSGHWTIEGAYCSQFENHIRAICGLPLGSSQSLGEYQMINVLGSFPKLDSLLQEWIHVHNYAKEFKPGRKRGHLTFIRDKVEADVVSDLYLKCAQEPLKAQTDLAVN